MIISFVAGLSIVIISGIVNTYISYTLLGDSSSHRNKDD